MTRIKDIIKYLEDKDKFFECPERWDKALGELEE